MFNFKSIDLKSIDIKSLITEALDINKAQKTTVAVQILLDETASPEFQVFVRSGFNSTSVNSRLTVGYYPSQDISVSPDTDLVVMAAGTTENTGQIAATIRNGGVPVLVIAEDGNAVKQSAQAAGYPLPDDTVIALPAGQALNEEIEGDLAEKIGTWIIENDHEKRLAFSIAFPFVRRPLARNAIRATSAQNAGIGVLVFIPGADMPAMTLNQIKMVLQIAAAYGQPLDKDRLKEVLPAVASALVCRSAARKLTSFIPVLGFAFKGGIGYAGTYAIGEALLTYFEAGGDVAGLAGVLSQVGGAAAGTASKVYAETKGQTVGQAAGTVARQAASKAVGVAGDVAKNAASDTMDYVKNSLFKKGSKE